MSYVIEASPSYKFKVRFNERNEEGEAVPREFHARFRRMGESEIRAMTERPDYCDAVVVAETLIGWEGVMAPDGTALPFEPATLAALLDKVGVRSAIVRSFFESLDTESTEAAAEKN